MTAVRIGGGVRPTRSPTTASHRVNDQNRNRNLQAGDRELVDLLTAVLVDPNLHTDMRMRLHQQVSAILRATREDLYGAIDDAPDPVLAAAGDEDLPDLLTAVLVDPNLYTDLRMRLHREIRLVLGCAPATRAYWT